MRDNIFYFSEFHFHPWFSYYDYLCHKFFHPIQVHTNNDKFHLGFYMLRRSYTVKDHKDLKVDEFGIINYQFAISFTDLVQTYIITYSPTLARLLCFQSVQILCKNFVTYSIGMTRLWRRYGKIPWQRIGFYLKTLMLFWIWNITITQLNNLITKFKIKDNLTPIQAIVLIFLITCNSIIIYK